MKKLFFLVLVSGSIECMQHVIGQEVDEQQQLTEAIDREGNVLVEENELVAVKRAIDKKYRIGQVRVKPAAASQFTGLATFNQDASSSYMSFAVNFKTNVRRLPAGYFQNINEPKTSSQKN